MLGHSSKKTLLALANETSPYLLQHADNPVEWYPWIHASLATGAMIKFSPRGMV